VVQESCSWKQGSDKRDGGVGDEHCGLLGDSAAGSSTASSTRSSTCVSRSSAAAFAGRRRAASFTRIGFPLEAMARQDDAEADPAKAEEYAQWWTERGCRRFPAARAVG
jgi:hypothetical protein